MNKHTIAALALAVFAISSCDNAEPAEVQDSQIEKHIYQSILEKVDDLSAKVATASTAAATDLVVTLDHHRMAAEYGVYTPPAQAMLFSDPEINSKILAASDQLVALDLPFKALAYSEPDTTEAKLAYTSALFIAKRHALEPSILHDYNIKLLDIAKGIKKSTISTTSFETVQEGFGIVVIQSAFDFEQTVERLKNIVNAQDDTRWFGEIDFQADASRFNIAIKPTTLLLFGGPAPGAKAMMTTPKIGLDAFCQKLLVYQDDEGTVWVAYNDIVEFSNLYYNTSTKPQEMINNRLKATFTKAVSGE